jgi:hypothetical protein
VSSNITQQQYIWTKLLTCIRLDDKENIPISNIRLNPAQHVNGSLVDLQEHTIEDLQNQTSSIMSTSKPAVWRADANEADCSTPTCLKRRSCKIFRVLGCMALILEFNRKEPNKK